MPRHKFTKEECSKGGRVRAQQPDFYQAGLKGRDTSAERYGRQFIVEIVRTWKRRKACTGGHS